jgi:hypothetical protein
MSYKFLIAIVISVLLSAAAQLLMKAGMSTAAVRQTLMFGNGPVALALVIAQSPRVLLGLCSFAISVIAWLLILAQVDVSQAYSFVSLGIVITALGAHFSWESH